jgi:uncharacterized membrane protein
MFCHACGTAVSAGVQFCPNCGQPLAATPTTSGMAPQAAWTPPIGIKSQSGRWISEGWQMVKADMGAYVLLGLVFAALSSVVPMVLQGPMLVGFHIFCIKKMLNRRAELGDLFKGFDFFLPAFVASLIISVFVFAGTLACIIPGLVVAAMYKFTYLFILDKRMDFWPAMQASHAVVKNDYFGFTMFLLLMALVNFLGFLCCIVGLLVSIPVTLAAVTVAYKEIVGFDPRTAETL